MMDKREWVEVEEAPDQLQANILKGLLEAQGVTVLVTQEGYQQAIGLAGFGSAMVKIMVPNDQEEMARQVLDDFYSGKFEDEDEQ
jgi:hypothetical protein